MQLIHLFGSNSMSLGRNLQKIRKELGLRQEELAERAGVSLTQISKIERNEADPRVSTIEKISKVLGCSTDKLLFDAESAGLNGMMKTAFERATKLRPRDKGVLITVINKYCSASLIQDEFFAGLDKSTIETLEYSYYEMLDYEEGVDAEIDALVKKEQ